MFGGAERPDQRAMGHPEYVAAVKGWTAQALQLAWGTLTLAELGTMAPSGGLHQTTPSGGGT